MGFVHFTNDHLACSSITIDNYFFKNYLADIPDEYLKPYFYGLYVITNNIEKENQMQAFCQKLKIDEKKVFEAFTALEDIGLVEITNINPLEIKYLELKESTKHKRIKPEKYSDFSLQVQKVLSERMISPNEFNEYFYFIETYKIEPSALIMIIKYCTDIKGVDVSYKYILTVAENWAKKGILTVSSVTDELTSRAKTSKDIEKILAALKVKRHIENEDNTFYVKWTKEYGFDIDNILIACGLLKNKKNMFSLDKLLFEFFTNKAFTQLEMNRIVGNKEQIKTIAIKAIRELGLYYENPEPVITYYIKPWINMGYSEDSVVLLAKYCQKKDLRSFEKMHDIIQNLFSQGIISTENITQHIYNISERDKKLSNILARAGISCQVNKWHRENYTTWSDKWGFADNIIEYAAELSISKVNPIAYMNAILSNFKSKSIMTLDDAKKQNITSQNMNSSHNRTYTDEELSNMIDDIDSIEL